MAQQYNLFNGLRDIGMIARQRQQRFREQRGAFARLQTAKKDHALLRWCFRLEFEPQLGACKADRAQPELSGTSSPLSRPFQNVIARRNHNVTVFRAVSLHKFEMQIDPEFADTCGYRSLPNWMVRAEP